MTADSDSTSTKTCTKCGECKPTSSYWALASSPDGLAWNCRDCACTASAAWRLANKDRLKVSKAKHHADNKGHYNALSRAWYLANKEYANAKCNQRAAEHREKAKATAVRWRLDNLERSRSGVSAWKKANPEIVRKINEAFLAANPGAKRVYENNRRKQSIGKLSRGIIQRLLELQRGMCPCCKQPLGQDYHLDHKMPLTLGGLNTDDNMQLLRKTCNLQKNAKHPVDFMQSRGFLL